MTELDYDKLDDGRPYVTWDDFREVMPSGIDDTLCKAIYRFYIRGLIDGVTGALDPKITAGIFEVIYKAPSVLE